MTDVYGDKLIYWTHHFTKILYDQENIFSASELVSGLMGGVNAIDRNKIFKENMISEIDSPIPSITNAVNKDFSEVCIERATEILLTDMPVNVYWSGGIDSTLALVSLIQVASDNNKMDQLNVTLQTDSIPEYPLFFKKYVKNMNHTILDDIYYRREFDLDNFIIVTGDPAPSIFGHSNILDSFNDERNMSWKNIFDSDKYFSYTKGRGYLTKVSTILRDSKKSQQFLREKMEVQVQSCPFEIKTVFDFYWWCSFCFRWNCDVFRVLEYDVNMNKTHYMNNCSFFRCDDFQIWSLLNHDKKIRDDFKSYKYILKDFIYDFTGDSEYRDNKIKGRSGRYAIDRLTSTYQKRQELIKTNQIIMAVDNNLKPIYMYDIFTHSDEMNKFKVDLDNDNFFKL